MVILQVAQLGLASPRAKIPVIREMKNDLFQNFAKNTPHKAAIDFAAVAGNRVGLSMTVFVEAGSVVKQEVGRPETGAFLRFHQKASAPCS